MNDDRISPDDIESGLRALTEDVGGAVDDAKPRLLPIVAAVGVVIMLVAYLVGRRVGKTKSTVVEIRRV